MANSYLEKQCPHGNCLNHNPEWQKVEERLVPLKSYFWERHFCCGKRMNKYLKAKILQCKKCGRIENTALDEIVVCSCCGYHYILHYDDY